MAGQIDLWATGDPAGRYLARQVGITGLKTVLRFNSAQLYLALNKDVPPYVMTVGQPAAAHSVNSEGLKRRGFTPEQIRGAMVDARTDIFSLGLVLFEMLSGRKAFWGEALETVVYRIMSEPVPPLHEQPAAINAVIQMAAQKDPGQRFVSAAQMKAALKGGVGGSNTSFARQPQTGWQGADQTVMASPSLSAMFWFR